MRRAIFYGISSQMGQIVAGVSRPITLEDDPDTDTR